MIGLTLCIPSPVTELSARNNKAAHSKSNFTEKTHNTSSNGLQMTAGLGPLVILFFPLSYSVNQKCLLMGNIVQIDKRPTHLFICGSFNTGIPS